MAKKLRPVIQNYAWGKTSGSVIHRATNSDDKTTSPLAELWLGAHKNGMAQVQTEKGEVPMDEFCGSEVPGFLLKLLAVDKPLSIQSHPCDSLAPYLHATQPEHYKDPNSKPEMTIALSETFQALIGFRSPKEMKRLFDLCPLLMQISIGHDVINGDFDYGDRYETCLRIASVNLLSRSVPKEVYEATLEQIRSKCLDDELLPVLESCIDEYGHDARNLIVFLMRYISLKKGEAVYLPAGLMHAYIKGDCIEIMNLSDNVLRGGLTPKYIDTENLLRFSIFGYLDTTIKPKITKKGFKQFSPCKYFKLSRYDKLDAAFAGEVSASELSLSGSCILLSLCDGMKCDGDQLKFGSALLLDANFKHNIENGSDFLIASR